MMHSGVCSAGFSTTQLPAASAGANFQTAIRIGKFQGMICPTTPERLVKMIGHRVIVELAERSFLSAHAAGEVAEMIDGERQVREIRLADRFAIVVGLHRGEERANTPPCGPRSD